MTTRNEAIIDHIFSASQLTQAQLRYREIDPEGRIATGRFERKPSSILKFNYEFNDIRHAVR